MATAQQPLKKFTDSALFPAPKGKTDTFWRYEMAGSFHGPIYSGEPESTLKVGFDCGNGLYVLVLRHWKKSDEYHKTKDKTYYTQVAQLDNGKLRILNAPGIWVYANGENCELPKKLALDLAAGMELAEAYGKHYNGGRSHYVNGNWEPEPDSYYSDYFRNKVAKYGKWAHIYE